MSAPAAAQLLDEHSGPRNPAWARAALLGPLAALAAAGAVTVVVRSDVLVWPDWFAFFSAFQIVAFTAAGLLWLRVRPGGPVGFTLLGLAAVTALESLQGSSSPLLFSIGVLVDPLFVLIAWYLLAIFPSAKLTRPAGALLATAVLAVGVTFVPWFFLTPVIAGGTPLARCTVACPTNALLITNDPTVAGHFGTAEAVLAVAVATGFLVLFASRLFTATTPRRRVYTPVYAMGIFWFITFGTYQVLAYLVVANQHVYTTLGWLLTGARIAYPLAFVAGLVAARMFAASALSTMLLRARGRPGNRELELAAQEALGDPHVSLAFWQPDTDGWVDASGQPVIEGKSDRRSSCILFGAGQPAAKLWYDVALDEDPEVVEAVATAVLLSIEQGATRSELQSFERRLATAEVDTRRRIERDLHDNAQQRLVALRIRMGLAPDLLARHPDRVSAELGDFGRELDAVLDELRVIAQGAYPPVLREEGLSEALADAVRTHPRARLSRGRLKRYSQDLEAAVYFSAVEALHDATKRVGVRARIRVSLWEEAGELRFEVRDDGSGSAAVGPPADGDLAEIDQRLAGLGGTLEVRSHPDGGTQVRGSVPV